MIQATQFGNYTSGTNRTRYLSGLLDEPCAPQSSRLITQNGWSFDRDAVGNRTEKLNTLGHGQLFAYADNNRLAQISNRTSLGDSVIMNYQYDGRGQRASKITSGSSTHFIYSQAGQLLGEYHTQLNIKFFREYIYFNGQPVAVYQADMELGNTSSPMSSAIKRKTKPVNKTMDEFSSYVLTNEETYYIHSDHLGTPRRVTDTNQTLVWRWDSTPFGTGKPNEDPDGDGKTLTLNQRFPGQYYDQETGLHYNYSRYYDAETGRYITSDPIGLLGGLNTYSYAYQNPIMYYDPNGETAVYVGRWFWWAGSRIGGRLYPHLSVPIGDAVDWLTDANSTRRQAEYLRMKRWCDNKPRKTGEKCADLSREINHYQNCVKWYEYWDRKWQRNRHATKIQNWKNRVKNLKQKYDKECTDKPCP